MRGHRVPVPEKETKQAPQRGEAEIDRVTTPGGLTIKGLNAMEAAGFTHSVIEGLRASTIKK